MPAHFPTGKLWQRFGKKYIGELSYCKFRPYGQTGSSFQQRVGMEAVCLGGVRTSSGKESEVSDPGACHRSWFAAILQVSIL